MGRRIVLISAGNAYFKKVGVASLNRMDKGGAFARGGIIYISENNQ